MTDRRTEAAVSGTHAARPGQSPSAQQSRARPEPVRPAPLPPAADRKRGRLVVVITDDAPLRDGLRVSLAIAGYTCEACDWSRASTMVLKLRPHAIVAEVDLNSTEQLTRYAALRKEAPRQPTPTVLMSRTLDAAGVARAAQHGGLDIVPTSAAIALVPARILHTLRMHDLIRSMRTSEAEHRRFVQAMPDTVLRVDNHGTLREVVSVGSGAIGLAIAEHGGGRRLDDLLPVPSDCSFADLCVQTLATQTAAERDLVRSEGATVHCWNFRLIPLGTLECIVILRDMTGRAPPGTEDTYELRYDPLTGLPNRARFMSRLEASLAASTAEVAVVRVQVDQFDRIEQSLGPATADEFLAELGRRLLSVCETGTEGASEGEPRLLMAARLPPAGFAILAVGVTDRSHCDIITQTIRDPLGKPVIINGREVRSTLSIGVSLSPDNGNDPEVMVRNAGLAANNAKAGSASRLYTDTMRMRSLRSLDIEAQLRRAIENNELSLQYQPKVDIETQRLLGFEALLRW